MWSPFGRVQKTRIHRSRTKSRENVSLRTWIEETSVKDTKQEVFTKVERMPKGYGVTREENVWKWRKGSVQFSHSVMSDSLWFHGLTVARQASLSITSSQSLLKLMSIKLVMSSNHLILCHPLFLLPSIFSSIRVFSNESVLRIRWPKYGASASASVLLKNIQWERVGERVGDSANRPKNVHGVWLLWSHWWS